MTVAPDFKAATTRIAQQPIPPETFVVKLKSHLLTGLVMLSAVCVSAHATPAYEKQAGWANPANWKYPACEHVTLGDAKAPRELAMILDLGDRASADMLSVFWRGVKRGEYKLHVIPSSAGSGDVASNAGLLATTAPVGYVDAWVRSYRDAPTVLVRYGAIDAQPDGSGAQLPITEAQRMAVQTVEARIESGECTSLALTRPRIIDRH